MFSVSLVLPCLYAQIFAFLLWGHESSDVAPALNSRSFLLEITGWFHQQRCRTYANSDWCSDIWGRASIWRKGAVFNQTSSRKMSQTCSNLVWKLSARPAVKGRACSREGPKNVEASGCNTGSGLAGEYSLRICVSQRGFTGWTCNKFLGLLDSPWSPDFSRNGNEKVSSTLKAKT